MTLSCFEAACSELCAPLPCDCHADYHAVRVASALCSRALCLVCALRTCGVSVESQASSRKSRRRRGKGETYHS